MGKGSGNNQERPSLFEEEDLTQQVYLARAAVENWARYSDGPADLHDARFALLDSIRDQGELSMHAPEWMTSPKPGIDAYIFLPDQVYLGLVRDPQGGHGKTFLAKNCFAPRRGRTRSPERRQALKRASFTPEALAELVALDTSTRRERTWISVHALERFALRTGDAITVESIQSLLEGAQVKPAPIWADAAGHGGPVLSVEYNNDQLAFPVMPDNQERRDSVYAITTCISRTWTERELADVAKNISTRILFSSKVTHRFDAVTFTRLLENGEILASYQGKPGPFLAIGTDIVRLRPATDRQRAQGHFWIGQDIIETT